MSHTDRLNRVIDTATETITTAQLTIRDAQLTIRTTIAALAAIAAIPTTQRAHQLGVTRTAFLWRVVDMSRKPGARNILLCKRSFTPELIRKIKYQCRIVIRALESAVHKTKAFTQEVTGKITRFGKRVGTYLSTPKAFMLYLIGLGYDSCLRIVQQADEHMPPKCYKHFVLAESSYSYEPRSSNGKNSEILQDIYARGHSEEYETEFKGEPRIGAPDYCERVNMYSDPDTNNEIPDNEVYNGSDTDDDDYEVEYNSDASDGKEYDDYDGE